MTPTILDRVRGLFGAGAARHEYAPPAILQVKSDRHDVTLLQHADAPETRKIELMIGRSETRWVTERVTSIVTATMAGRYLLITTGAHVFVCDGDRVVFEDTVLSDVTTRGEVYGVHAIGERVVLKTEFEVCSLDLRVMPPRFEQRWTAQSGILDSVCFDGGVVEMRDEGGNVETCRFE